MRGKKLALLAAAFVAATLWGCGSNRDSGGDQTSGGPGSVGSFGNDANGVAFVGAATCIGCHEDFSWSSDEVASFLKGKHVVHSDHITAAEAAEGCLECHDSIGDGRTLEALIDPANIPAEGLAAVTCESCHGAGGQHFGVGPMPNARPDYTACGQCHGALPENHLTYHPEANNIATKYENSGHFTEENSHNSNVCSKCHTDEGARLYKDIDNVDRLETVVLAVPAPSKPIQCRTCHDPHNAGELLETASDSASAEYRTCTNCHQAHDADVGTTKRTLAGSTSTDGASADGDLIYHATRWNRVITTTHYDDPATAAIIEGYAMNPASERACRDCHDVHAANVAINEQWAQSAHGGHLMEAKEAAVTGARTIAEVNAVKSAGATDATAPGWVHYNWDQTTGDGNRAGCQRCHTATGAKNFLTAPATYIAANNDFSHLVDWTAAAGSGQNEMLYCWGCHSNNSGALRNPGAITETYDPLVVVSYPDVAASNVCMACHLGRETGEVIKVDADADGDRSFINSHYLAAGGTVFTTTGYEYEGRNYNNVAFYAHDEIGTAGQPGTGSSGPCVGCHMTSAEPHHFQAVEADGAGTITAITSDACNTCHPGLSAGEMNTWKTQYAAALAALQAALDAKGIFFAPAHPYFYNGPDGTGGAFTDWDGVAVSFGLPAVPGYKDVMGAAFNFNLLKHDPGAFAHNKFYSKGLIWDSIDFIHDGVLDNDVPEAIAALTLDAATRVAANEYLGTTRPGDGSRVAP